MTPEGAAKAIAKYAEPDPNSGCWLWSGSIDTCGYGRAYDGDRSSAHRAAWLARYGEIPKGLLVMHKCDTRACCNPDHLQLGTQKDNMADCAAKGRIGGAAKARANAMWCNRGHALISDNVFIRPDGSRACRTCKRARKKRNRQKNRINASGAKT